jgi:hypothetical protein
VNEAPTESPDIALFLEHAGWLGPRLPDPSWLGLLGWVGARLSPEAVDRLRGRLPLETSEQKAAEQAVVQLLQAGLVSPQRRTRVSETIERSVDWSRTWTETLTHPPCVYYAIDSPPQSDRRLLAALASLAWSWSSILRSFGWQPGHQARASQLAEAHRLWRHLSPGNYGSTEERRLLRVNRPAALAIGTARRFWSRRFGAEEGAHGALRRMAEWLSETDASNKDTLLELTASLSIARAATLASPEDRVDGQPWALDSIKVSRSKYPSMQLRSGNLLCRIEKGVPKIPGGGQLSDRIGPVLAGLCLDSTGNQPDIVLVFHLASQPERFLIALADAKRNMKDDGTGYLRSSVEVAMVYMVSYGHGMRLSLGREAHHQFAGALLPGVTLFCRQAARHHDGKKELISVDERVAFWRSAGAESAPRLPVVAAFDLDHFGCGSSAWNAPILAAWLGCLGRQALRYLADSPTIA